MFDYILPDDNESFDLLVNTKMRIVADVHIHFSWGWKIKPFLIVNFLTTQTTVGIGFYYLIKKILKENLDSLTLNKESKVAIIGTGELAELAYLALLDIGVDEIDMYGNEDDKPIFLGMHVQYMKNMEVSEYSKIVVTLEDIDLVHTVLKEKSSDSNQIVGLLKNGQMVK